MSNSYALTKRVDQDEFIAELVAGGVVLGINIDSTKVYLLGAPDQATLDAQLALIGPIETAHAPTTISEAALSTAPHVTKFLEECLAVSGVGAVSVELPSSYPGTAVLIHNSLDETERANLIAAAEAHDASTIPSLSFDTPSQVIAADGVATGTVTVTDSRGASASGKAVRLRIPSGGSAGVDADSFVLDGSGQATATFQATTTYTGELTFMFFYDSGEADTVTFTVRRGT